MFAVAPEMDGPMEALWDEELARQSRRRYLRKRRSLGRPARLAKLRADLFKRQNGHCHYCGRQMVNDAPRISGMPRAHEEATLEHLVSFADGGVTSGENCRAVCFLCNNLKGELDQAIRSLERSMREGFPHEVHHYADRLRRALAEWERRNAQPQEGRTS
jgi:hypothetical protein